MVLESEVAQRAAVATAQAKAGATQAEPGERKGEMRSVLARRWRLLKYIVPYLHLEQFVRRSARRLHGRKEMQPSATVAFFFKPLTWRVESLQLPREEVLIFRPILAAGVRAWT